MSAEVVPDGYDGTCYCVPLAPRYAVYARLCKKVSSSIWYTSFVLLPLVLELFNVGFTIPRFEPFALETIASINTVPPMSRTNAVSIRLESACVQWLARNTASSLLFA